MWVARNRDNSLLLWMVYPNPIDEETGYWQNPLDDGTNPFMPLDKLLFSDVRYGDEPVEVFLMTKQALDEIDEDAYQSGYEDGYDSTPGTYYKK